MISLNHPLKLTRNSQRQKRFTTAQRWAFIILTAMVALATLSLLRRFSIWQLPPAWHSQELPAGSTLLMDWSWQRGRPPGDRDWIVWHAHGRRLFGRIMAIVRPADAGTREACYLVKPTAGGDGDWLLVEANQIRGRVLLVWSPLSEHALPK